MSNPLNSSGSELYSWPENIDTALPIRSTDIPDFSAWINCNGFRQPTEIDRGHDGFDFGAYLNEAGGIVVGLPLETPVRAIANGVVKEILHRQVSSGYACSLSIEHGEPGSQLLSSYTHIAPGVEVGDEVPKGGIIGGLYSDIGTEYGRLVHLHLSLVDGTRKATNPETSYDTRLYLDPKLIDPAIYEHTIREQGWAHFSPTQVLGATAIQVAHFDIVDVNNHRWRKNDQ